jgi:hypothetical protein
MENIQNGKGMEPRIAEETKPRGLAAVTEQELSQDPLFGNDHKK